MKQEESTAKKYLDQLSRGEVQYEPDGNISPDFSLASTIAIEVRRLNENYFANGTSEGLEQVSIPFQHRINQLLASYDASYDGQSYWVGLIYKRPLPGGVKAAVKQIRKVLDGFLEGPRNTPCSLKVKKDLWLEIFPGAPRPNQLFRRGIESDDDSGGLVVQLYIQNISHSITEKSPKIVPHKHRYNEWWLLLVDTIMAWNLLPHEIDQIRAGIASLGEFDKLIVIDFFGCKCLLEIDR